MLIFFSLNWWILCVMWNMLILLEWKCKKIPVLNAMNNLKCCLLKGLKFIFLFHYSWSKVKFFFSLFLDSSKYSKKTNKFLTLPTLLYWMTNTYTNTAKTATQNLVINSHDFSTQSINFIIIITGTSFLSFELFFVLLHFA